MKWISIKDRLPLEGENVLVWVDYKAYQEHDVGYLSSFGSLCILGFFDEKHDEQINVTHWMSLPEPPEDSR